MTYYCTSNDIPAARRAAKRAGAQFAASGRRFVVCFGRAPIGGTVHAVDREAFAAATAAWL